MAQPPRSGRSTESVWDYPRPPAVELCYRRVRVEHGGELIADSTSALRVLETASPPTIYVPAADVRTELLRPVERVQTACEWKGSASYFDVVVAGKVAGQAAWTYQQPKDRYAELHDHFAFYAGRVDVCRLDDERVTPQGGSFYGGWVSAEIAGPYKGEPGSEGW